MISDRERLCRRGCVEGEGVVRERMRHRPNVRARGACSSLSTTASRIVSFVSHVS